MTSSSPAVAHTITAQLEFTKTSRLANCTENQALLKVATRHNRTAQQEHGIQSAHSSNATHEQKNTEKCLINASPTGMKK